MAAKFQVGDMTRLGGKGRPLPACYPWLKRGQLCRVQAVHSARVLHPEQALLEYRNYLLRGHHLMYEFAPRRGQPAVLLASFDLRRPEERDRAPGAGRKRAAAL